MKPCDLTAVAVDWLDVIRNLATDPKKRELFDRPAAHLTVLASEVNE
jgi:hypothetical protein